MFCPDARLVCPARIVSVSQPPGGVLRVILCRRHQKLYRPHFCPRLGIHDSTVKFSKFSFPFFLPQVEPERECAERDSSGLCCHLPEVAEFQSLGDGFHHLIG